MDDLSKQFILPYNQAAMNEKPNPDPAKQQHREARQFHWDSVARKRDNWHGMGLWYHHRIEQIYRFLISPGQHVLEIGSGTGDLLSAVQPEVGMGIDFSAEQVRRATERYAKIEFIQADAHDLSAIKGSFNTIILSDLINELWDVQEVFEQIKPLCTSSTRVVINFYSRFWEIPLQLTQLLNLATPTLAQNWLTHLDVINMLNLAGFETIRYWQEILLPLPLGSLFNNYLVRLWPFKEFALVNFLVARPEPVQLNAEPSVSVVVPARNEAGNIKAIFDRVPNMGCKTELLFIEGHSQDDTFAVIENQIVAHPDTRSLLLRQSGTGKADAVRLGFEHASGDILMILDADLTVPPEDLPRFYEALVSGKGEFINGVRLVYPMEEQAMRSLNLLGNKFFSVAFSWLLGQPIKDTLCGTKVLWKKDYEVIAANRSYFGDFDPFGDFDLIFGAAKQNLKIVDLPIRYRERVYGSTNISRWKHGVLLMRMVAFAARRLKFV